MKKKKCICLGSFDGLHRGHMKVLENGKGSEYETVLVTFDVHPADFFSNKAHFKLLQKQIVDEKLKEKNIIVSRLPSDRVYELTAEDFFEKVLLKSFSPDKISCGYNYTFGKDKKGDVDLLRNLCEKSGIILSVAEPIECDGEVISSTRIRKKIADGEIDVANELLGYKFCYRAEVIHGDKRGSTTLQTPTANQIYPDELIVPKFGVYKSSVIYDGKEYKAITNIGLRPTIGTNIFLSETHIIDFSKDIYGEVIEVNLEKFIRPERQFDSLNDLKNQIKNDISEAKK
ncbi:MAG: riboflavin biosynthesis protein RibF [Clostridia bacterium]|nr:riboflavin biosynthesis protein RibF [Clostridia bacterium]MBQ4604307.1 riboflavin biosynthesis protein RibF [Clostridia bacterium]